jgi:hypothetical protein
MLVDIYDDIADAITVARRLDDYFILDMQHDKCKVQFCGFCEAAGHQRALLNHLMAMRRHIEDGDYEL